MSFQCCFCGSAIEEKQAIELTVSLAEPEATQALWSHSACLANVLHPSVPVAFAGADTIFMPLLNEGVDVWRPVQARKLEGDCYQITASVSVPEGENWPFKPGSTVRCALKTFQGGGVGLVAVAQVRTDEHDA